MGARTIACRRWRDRNRHREKAEVLSAMLLHHSFRCNGVTNRSVARLALDMRFEKMKEGLRLFSYAVRPATKGGDSELTQAANLR